MKEETVLEYPPSNGGDATTHIHTNAPLASNDGGITVEDPDDNHQDDQQQRPSTANPREFHTAESFMDYLQEERADKGGKRQDSFKDYLKAQKALKAQQQQHRRESLSRLFQQQQQAVQKSSAHLQKSTTSMLRQSVIPEDGVAEEEGEAQAQSQAPTHNKHRITALHAMSVLGRRQPSVRHTEEWQSFMDSQDRLAAMENHHHGAAGNAAGDNTAAAKNGRNNSTTPSQQEGAKEDSHEQQGGADHHDNHGHHDNLTVPFYCRPLQRQRWGDDFVLPHINWGDLFFDLFFVAAAYNLGAMLISSMGGSSYEWPRGVVYFIGIFGPLYNTWENDVIYSSRYTLVDYAHRIIAVLRFLCVGMVVLSIKTVGFLGDKHSAETFSLVLALLVESLLQLGLNLELYFCGEGDRIAIQNHTRRKLLCQFVPASVTYLIATIIAGKSYFGQEHHKDDYHHDSYGKDDAYHGDNKDDHGYSDGYPDPHHNDNYNDTSADAYYNNQTTTYNNETDHEHFRMLAAAASSTAGCYDDDGHRLLAGGGDYYDNGCTEEKGLEWTIADVPLILCLAIYVFNMLFTLYRKYRGGEAQDLRHQFVPNNVDYLIHRYGEWTMLMVGESILSLLIVETIESEAYYAIAAVGCLTVIVVQMLKFESEPSHATGHALWRSMFAAQLFSILIQILSIGLICFGVSYKIMLTNVLLEELEGAGIGHRMLQLATEELPNLLLEALEDIGHRRLAAVPKIADEAVASLFCGSLTIVLVSLEMMLGTHKGVTKSYQLLFHEIESFHIFSLNYPLMFISVFKIFVILFTATLSQWATDPYEVAILGFLIVTAMAITRIVGWGFVNHEQEIMDTVTMMKSQATDIGRDIMYQASDVGRDIMYQASDVGRDLLFATHSVASKALQATGVSDKTSGTVASNEEEIAIDKALDTSFDAVVVTDRIGIIRHVNKQVLEEFGYESEYELVGNNVSMLVGGGEAAHHHMYMDRFNKNEQRTTTIGKQRTLQARRKTGEEFACVIGIKEIPNTGLLVGYIRSLSQLDEKTKESPAKHAEHVDDTSFDSIIVIDPRGTILNVNLTALGEFGYESRSDLVGNNISILVGGGEGDNHDGYLSAFDADNRNNATIGGNKRVVHAKRKDETEFPCVIGIRRAPDSDNLIGYIRNMTGITPEEDAVKEKTKYLCDDTSFDSIVITDAEGKILQVNATTVEEFGYLAKAELVGKDITILVGGGHAKHHSRYMKRFQQKGNEETAIGKRRALKARRKNGKEFSCVIGIRKIPETDWLIGYIRSTEGLSKKRFAAEYDSISQLSTARSGTASSLDGRSRHTASSGGDNIMDESFDAIIVASFDGIIKKVNQTVLDTFLYQSKDELVGQNIKILVGGGEADLHDMYLEKFHAEGKSSSQIGKQRVLYSRRKDGSEFPCLIGIKKTPKNDALIAWIRDMSEVSHERSSIQITNMKMLDPVERLVDDNSFDAIIVTTTKGLIRRVNQTTVREFGYDTKDELIGRNVSDLVGGKVSAKLHDRYMERFQTEGKSSSTIGKQRILKSKRKDGTEFRCIIGINRIPDTTEDLLIGYIRNLEMTYEPTHQSDIDTTASASVAARSQLSRDSHDSFGD